MDYTSFYEVAQGLISDFGAPAVLNKQTNSYDKRTGKVTKTVVNHDGIAVKTKYSAESMGQSDSMIKAGDVKIIGQFPVAPVESKDQLTFGGVLYNIISVDTISPSGDMVIVYVMQGRKA